MMEPQFICTLSRSKYIRLLIGIMIVLIFLGAIKEIHVEANIGQGGIHPLLLRARALFDLNGEQNLPTWFSTINLLTCSLLTLAVGIAKRKSKERFVVRWFVLAAVFYFLGFDEAFAIHEELNAPLRSALGLGGHQLVPDYTSLFYYAWVIPYGVLTLIMGLIYIPFLMDLPAKTRTRFLIAGGIYVAGALILELVEGVIQSIGAPRLVYIFLYIIEEALEMFGIIYFINALLDHMRQRWPVISFCL